MEQTPCIRTPKKLGSKAIAATRKLHLLNQQLVIKSEDDSILIPLSRKPTMEETAALRTTLQHMNIEANRFVESTKSKKNILEVLRDQLSPELLGKVPRSIDIMGQVAIVEIPPELESYKHLVGEAILKVNRRIQTVLAKAGAVKGEYRLRALETIAGTGETETVYREYGCIFTLDPKKVYFSPRLSQERWRVAHKVSRGEVIIDMFAGVGPYSIQIAKKHHDTTVYAIDVNPDAVHFLKRNIAANKVDNVYPIQGNAREIVESCFIGKADRIIMNLPEDAITFIDVACKAIKPFGGIIHFYGFEAGSNALERGKKSLTKEVGNAGRTVQKILDSRLIRSTAPYEWQIVIDSLIT